MSSDRATLVNVKITGCLDTLFPNVGRAYFYRCEIWGNVDFIFGTGHAVFDDWMDDHIGAKGWDRMSSTDSTGARTWNLPENARFFEYGSTGPGAVASPSRRVLSPDEAKRYIPAAVLDGWIPAH